MSSYLVGVLDGYDADAQAALQKRSAASRGREASRVNLDQGQESFTLVDFLLPLLILLVAVVSWYMLTFKSHPSEDWLPDGHCKIQIYFYGILEWDCSHVGYIWKFCIGLDGYATYTIFCVIHNLAMFSRCNPKETWHLPSILVCWCEMGSCVCIWFSTL